MATDVDVTQIWPACLKLMLKPIVRFWLRSSHGLHGFVDVAKAAFVEVAREELQRSGQRVNVSRLSVMSGVHRKDVTRLLADEKALTRQASGIVSRVIGQWEQDKRFLNSSRKPRVLSCDGEGSEFYALVKLVSQSESPATVLFELERIGAVKRTRGGIKLLQRIPRFYQDPREGFAILGDEVALVIRAIEENILLQREIRNLHIRTYYNNVFKRDIPRIRSWLLDEGKKFHKRCRDYLSNFDKDINPGDDSLAGETVVIGSYSWTGEPESAKESQ